MLRLVSVPDGDYKIKSRAGGQIILAPGAQGNVIVDGNLTVTGNTSTIESTITTIRDPIITLNEGDPGLQGGISFRKSGLHINRGNGIPDTYIVHDEDVSWSDPNSGVVTDGVVNVFQESFSGGGTRIERTVPVKIGGIVTPTGQEFNFQGLAATGKITVDSASYTETLDSRASGYFIDDDDKILANKGYVDWKITDYLSLVGVPTISSTLVDGLTGAPILTTNVSVKQEGVNWNQNSEVRMDIDNLPVFRATLDDGFEFYNSADAQGLRIKAIDSGTLLESMGSNADLTISVNGTGSIKILDDLLMTSNVSEPALPAPNTGTKLYGGPVAGGGTGLYAATDEGRDELASRRKAIIYGLLF